MSWDFEVVVGWGLALVGAALIGFSVWLFAFDNGGCAAGQTPVQTGVMIMPVGKTLTVVPLFTCEATSS